MEKRNAGRQKVALEKIKSEDALQVTFSKRRNDVFKKAAELSILCGCDLGIFLFSPGGRAYSFGSPNVPLIMQRLLADRLAPQQEHRPGREMLVRGLTFDLLNVAKAQNQALGCRRELADTLTRADHTKASELVDPGHLSQYIAKVEGLKNLAELTKLELDHRAQTCNLPRRMDLFQQPTPMVDPCSFCNIATPVLTSVGARVDLPNLANLHGHNTSHGGVMGFGSACSSLHLAERSSMGQLLFDHPESSSQARGSFIHSM